MTFEGLTVTEAEGSARIELAPLTDAQRRTTDALALYCASCWRVPVDVAAVPSTFERGAVLVLVTPSDTGGAPDYVTAVYAADGTRHAVASDADYAAALAAAGGVHVPRVNATRRESTAAFIVRAGGSYLAEADAERPRASAPADSDCRTISYLPAGAAEHERELITCGAADIAEAARSLVARGASDLMIGNVGAFNVDGSRKADA